jgi:hypothetical protein
VVADEHVDVDVADHRLHGRIGRRFTQVAARDADFDSEVGPQLVGAAR